MICFIDSVARAIVELKLFLSFQCVICILGYNSNLASLSLWQSGMKHFVFNLHQCEMLLDAEAFPLYTLYIQSCRSNETIVSYD